MRIENNYENVAEELLEVGAQFMRQKSSKKLLEFLQGESQVLNYLHSKKGLQVYPKDISDSLVISQARVALLLNRLEKDGWIDRKTDEDDTRRTLVSITDKGIQELERRKHEILDNMLEALKKVGLEESNDLLHFTSTMVS